MKPTRPGIMKNVVYKLIVLTDAPADSMEDALED